MTENATTTTKPVVDMTIADAFDSLNGFEIEVIENYYRTKVEDLGTTKLLYALIHAFENRDGKTSWNDVKKLSMKDARTYFAEEDPDPDSEQGKDEA